MASTSFASSTRWPALLMVYDVHHRHRGPSGGHRGRGRRLVIFRGRYGSSIGGYNRSSGGRDRGGARSALGCEECGPRGSERGEEHADLSLPPRLVRLHIWLETAMKTAWTARSVDLPFRTPPLAAAASPLVRMTRSAPP